jgi:GNAT superfamily N-acetyltransferase
MPLSIRRLEELSLSAWPALATLPLDGWLLRFANGFTRRANCVNPLYPPTRPLEENLAAAEAIYAARGQPVIFKLTPAAEPPGLDASLAARGYALDARTSVQTLPLRPAPPAPNAQPAPPFQPPISDPPQALLTSRFAPPAGCLLLSALTPAWDAAFCALSGISAANAATQRQMLAHLVLPACFALRLAGDQPVAAGFAVAQDGYVGFFDIITHPAHRRQGHAAALMAALLDWARASGAHTAYLQVMLANAPALRLYAGLGFTELYQYWYRVKLAQDIIEPYT